MIKIKTYNKFINESLKDNIKGPELKGIQLDVYNAKKQLESLNLKTSKNIDANNGIYSFSIYNIHNIEINLHYFNYKNMMNKWSDEYLEQHSDGWNVYINKRNYDKGKKENYYLTGEWNDILKKIINIIYPDIDDVIKRTKNEIESLKNYIESNKNLLDGLKNAKQILNDN